MNGSEMKNLTYLVVEDPASNSISNLRKKVRNIESTSGPSKRTMQMRDEIMRLESLLEYREVRTNPSYKSFFRNELES